MRTSPDLPKMDAMPLRGTAQTSPACSGFFQTVADS